MNKIQEKAFQTLLKTDGYKLVHKDQYPQGTTKIFSTLFLRSSNHKYIKDDIYVFGLNYIKDELINEWDNFFNLSKSDVQIVLKEFEQFTRDYHNLPNYSVDVFYELWEFGKLPLDIRVVSDRTIVPIKSPIISIFNTEDKFYWLTNYIESYLLTRTWPLITSATTAYHLRNTFDKYLSLTSDNPEFSFVQGTDFSYRGMSGTESGLLSGIGHLAIFEGSSTMTATYEFGKVWKRYPKSVPATEHSVMMSYGKDEKKAFQELLNLYPNGILSIVSDTWNIWNVIDNILPQLKDQILSRDGKLTIRPDSGNPKLILCGNENSNDPQEKAGVLKLLEKHFGSTVNSKGYKVLNNKIGVIYGDSINFDTLNEILEGIKQIGFSTENVVFGLGATFYQNNNRDTFGHVFKSTYAEINGEHKNLYKDPITNSNKKSHKGIVGIFKNEDNSLEIKDQLTWSEFNKKNNLLK